VPPVDTSTLHGVTVLDLTFVSENEGWALASADCTSGAGRCSALFHVNGGKWGSLPNSTPFNVTGVTGGCGYPCVTNIRFANPQVGYAFGPEAFLMTLDGGHHWARQDGGAIALESLDGNVIRVTASSASGCPGPCNVAVETSSIGSTKWTRADLPSVSGTGISFSRGQPSNAYLLVTRSPAGGAADATSTLYRSTDDGASWQALGEPCPQTGDEVDSFAVSGSGTNRVSALCVSRQALQRIVVATSTDGGAHFVAQPGRIQPKSSGVLTGDPATVLVIAGETGLLRSGDGGRTWQHVAGVTGSIGFVGFESSTVGRAVSTDGTTIWTTRDAGETWQPVTFG
jgi:photosystem II stability/assembly factor-like uncharacterized protein